jgi:hypothetical protein
MYTRVTKKQLSSAGEVISKHYFTPAAVEYLPEAGGVPHNRYAIKDNEQGIEFKTEIFKNVNNTQSLIKSSETSFGSLKGYTDRVWNIQTSWAKGGTWSVWEGNDPYVQTPALNMEVKTNLYPHYKEEFVPMSKTETDYSNGLSITGRLYYEYDTANGNIKIVKSIDSKGDTLIKISKYAPDFGYYSGSIQWNNVVKSLVDLNMLASPIEVATYVKRPGTTQLLLTDATLMEYSQGKVNKVYKLFTESPLTNFQPAYNTSGSFYFDSRYKLVQEITQADGNNNPLTVSSDAKIESYVWDHSGTLPVAQVKNASNDNIAYSSFETTSNGNWTLTGGSVNTSYSVTGAKSYSINWGNSINKTNVTYGNYFVSYWSRNGSLYVNGNTGTSGLTKNGWTFYEHNINGAGSVSVTGSGVIDELRLYPQKALMATTTYEPLKGITSQCDVNNRILYYLYDKFNRLEFVKDADGNILKKICYNYAGDPEVCGSIVSCSLPANWQSTGQYACVLQNGIPTGYQNRQEKDIEPCSPTFNQTRWVSNGYNPTACPPVSCNTSNCSGVD